ncbi:hypothetical protein BH24PSE2_BH24PSE2_22540 [soil metagenome]
MHDPYSNQSRTPGGRTVEFAARVGYLAKGFLYLGVGALAGMAALGKAEGETTGVKGVLEELAKHPFGTIALILVAIGLAGHVIWRLYQAIADPADKGDDAKGLLMRSGFAVSGLVYASVALFALRASLGEATGGSDNTSAQTATLMSKPGGVWLVGIVGAIVIGVGLYQLWRAWRASFENKWVHMSFDTQRWATRLSRFGIAARAIVFLMTGTFLILAAWRHDPSQAKGLGGALSELASQPYGRYLLGAAALGLLCYGIYCAANARYRRLQT